MSSTYFYGRLFNCPKHQKSKIRLRGKRMKNNFTIRIHVRIDGKYQLWEIPLVKM